MTDTNLIAVFVYAYFRTLRAVYYPVCRDVLYNIKCEERAVTLKYMQLTVQEGHVRDHI